MIEVPHCGTFLFLLRCWYLTNRKFPVMNKIEKLMEEVSIARKKYLLQVSKFSDAQGYWKLSPGVWSMAEITEHLFWAEQGGILGMWKTINAIHDGKMERKYDSVHKNMPIEQIIDLPGRRRNKCLQ